MTGLRTARDLLPFLTLATCGLLLASVFVFHDYRLPSWVFSNSIPSIPQESVLKTTSLPGVSSFNFENESKDKSYEQSDNVGENLVIGKNIPLIATIQESVAHDDNPADSLISLQVLGRTLEEKIKVIVKKRKVFKPTCETDAKRANSCDHNRCLQTELPDDIRTRVKQLVIPPRLQMSPAEHKILREMADKVTGNYDIILLTAASSNHFLESQALLKNLHENVYPHLNNFTLVFYNLGLTEQERALMVKYCKCQVIDFPFDKFPQFMKSLKCYTWKPVLIKTHIQIANIVFWMDASIRFHNAADNLRAFILAARMKGLQIGGSNSDSTFRTYRSMYHFFGDEPCAYLTLGQAHATLGVYSREYFVDRVILEPWVACALSEDCMCPRNRSSMGCRESKIVAEKYYQGTGRIAYGMCHRYDQSAISIIIHKLYQELYTWVMVRVDSVLSIQRRHTFSYFPQE